MYPNEPYNIYVCKVFWPAPLSGTDSKTGTLIQEMSHFNVLAGTDDVVYGQTAARNLADTDPAAAITNADGHEYFAVNTRHCRDVLVNQTAHPEDLRGGFLLSHET